MSFAERVRSLPRLGLGVSTEYGATRSLGALDVAALRSKFPQYAGFLEVGVEVAKGLDTDTERWAASGAPTTYHFLDLNLDEPEDFDSAWLAGMRANVARLRPAWMCGDAGLWHFGRRDRGQMLLLPPILSDAQASSMAEGVSRLRAVTGLEVLPENPPGSAYVGPLHLLEFFARLCDRADTGMLLDCAHLAIFQAARGHEALDGLADFDLSRVVEIHVAGGRKRSVEGFSWIEDEHSPSILPETWRIVEHVVPRAPNLKAIVFECERCRLPEVIPAFRRLEALWG